MGHKPRETVFECALVDPNVTCYAVIRVNVLNRCFYVVVKDMLHHLSSSRN